jgi:hypothetical protein
VVYEGGYYFLFAFYGNVFDGCIVLFQPEVSPLIQALFVVLIFLIFLTFSIHGDTRLLQIISNELFNVLICPNLIPHLRLTGVSADDFCRGF